MLAMAIVPRVMVLMPCASGACAVKGEFHAVEVWTGTMIVWPSTVTALWSDGPAPPRRLATPALGEPGSASRNPKDCSSVISCRLSGDSGGFGVSVGGFMGIAPGSDGVHRGRGGGGTVVDRQAQQLGPRVVADRVHHSLALGDQRHV